MAKTISFDEFKAHKAKDVTIYEIEVSPEEIGLAYTPEQMGVDANGKPNKTIALKFRPFGREEYNEILESLKDEKGLEWADERDFAVVQLCLVEPEVPPTAEGRKFLEAWLPGVLTNVRQQIEEHSGYKRNWLVTKATDAIKNLEIATPAPTSTSK